MRLTTNGFDALKTVEQSRVLSGDTDLWEKLGENDLIVISACGGPNDLPEYHEGGQDAPSMKI